MRNIQSKLYDKCYYGDPKPIIDFIEWSLNKYKIKLGSHILDLGCGTGRMLREINQLGYRVTGLEPEPEYFEAATKHENENIKVLKGGFESLNQKEIYDAVLAINGPFSYLLTMKERKESVEKTFHSLRYGGIILLDLTNFLWILKNYRKPKESMTFMLEDIQVTRKISHEIDFHNCTWTHTDTFSLFENRIKKEIVKRHKFSIISYLEIEYLLSKIGFKNIRTFNSYESRLSEKLNGKRMLISGQK